MFIIRAKVLTDSSEDQFARVKLYSEGVWEESPLIESINAIPLKVGDFVFVQMEDDSRQPLILGRAQGSYQHYSTATNGSVLFDSSNGSKWTVAYVRNNQLVIETSDGSKIEVDNGNIQVKVGTLTVTGALHVDGEVAPTNSGGFCAIKYCPFTGAPHIGNEIK